MKKLPNDSNCYPLPSPIIELCGLEVHTGWPMNPLVIICIVSECEYRPCSPESLKVAVIKIKNCYSKAGFFNLSILYQITFCRGVVLCNKGCLAAFMASACWMPGASPSPSPDSRRCECLLRTTTPKQLKRCTGYRKGNSSQQHSHFQPPNSPSES